MNTRPQHLKLVLSCEPARDMSSSSLKCPASPPSLKSTVAGSENSYFSTNLLSDAEHRAQDELVEPEIRLFRALWCPASWRCYFGTIESLTSIHLMAMPTFYRRTKL